MPRSNILAGLLSLAIFAGHADAERVQLPCDKDASLQIGTSSFIGKTRDIQIERIMPIFFRVEGTLFDSCSPYDTIRHRFYVSRRWFGRANLHAMVTSEEMSLGLYPSWAGAVPDGEVERAGMTTGIRATANVGGRLSLYDSPRFHVESYFEYSSSVGAHVATMEEATIRGKGLSLDVTEIMRDHSRIGYEWNIYQAGVTVGIPTRSTAVAGHQIVIYANLGYMWFRADVDVELDRELTDDLRALEIDPENLDLTISVVKQLPAASAGARLDFNRDFSLDASMMYGYTGSQSAYWITLAGVFRFSYPWR